MNNINMNIYPSISEVPGRFAPGSAVVLRALRLAACAALLISALAVSLVAMPLPAAAAGESCEIVIYSSDLGGLMGALASSAPAAAFFDSALGTRFGQSLMYQKFDQVRNSLTAALGDKFDPARAREFLGCPCYIYVLRSDLDALRIVIEADRNITRYEYFTKYKKGLKTEKRGDSQIYVIESGDGIASFVFASHKDKTWFSNSAELLFSVISGGAESWPRPVFAAPAGAFIDTGALDARMTPAFSSTGGIFVNAYIPSKDGGPLRLVVHEGPSAPSTAAVTAALEDSKRAVLPLDLPAFFLSAREFECAPFFEKASASAASLEVAVGFRKLIDSAASASGKGVDVVIDPIGDDGIFVLASFASRGLPDGFKAAMQRYFPEFEIAAKADRLIVASRPVAGTGYRDLNLDWIAGVGRSVGVSSPRYYYGFSAKGAARIVRSLIAMARTVSEWNSSDAYEFAGDLDKSIDAIASAFASVLVASSSDASRYGGLNSVITIKFK